MLKYHCLYFLTGHVVYQVVSFCEQSDNKLGQMTSKTAYQGSTFDELHIFNGKFEYKLFSNYTEPETIRNLEQSKSRLEKVYYPACINMLKNYLKKRETQLNRKGIMLSTINSHFLKFIVKIPLLLSFLCRSFLLQ